MSLRSHDIDEVILALEEDEYQRVENIVNTICYRDVLVKAVPSMRQVIAGHVEAGPIYATPLLRVSYREMPHWQQMIKQTLDYSCRRCRPGDTLPADGGAGTAHKIIRQRTGDLQAGTYRPVWQAIHDLQVQVDGG
ncbi:MAG: hypothetical protein MZV63_68480 [Marinilabiliales bacterium]|nr:hypothetical protein [Marinilabiliales bacterium]